MNGSLLKNDKKKLKIEIVRVPTMTKKSKTMELQGNPYAKVAERLKLFREAHPNGKHESAYEADPSGATVFTVWLWKDKSDVLDLIKNGVTDIRILRASADSNGTAKGEQKAKKDFEKLESIALGRALANLGFLASGEIASSEEMERFQEYEIEKKDNAIENLKAAKTIDELKEVFMGLGSLMADQEIISLKDQRKSELCKPSTSKKTVKNGSKQEKEKSQVPSSETSLSKEEQVKNSDSMNSSQTG
jgi:hypothetical protein